jgi:glyoxylate reductase
MARRVAVTRRLPPGSLDPLTTPAATAADHDVEIIGPEDDDRPLAPHELADRAARADAMVCLLTDHIDAAVLEHATLKVVANVAVGYDNIDVAAAAARGIAVCNTPGVLDDTTADAAFLLILAAARRATKAEDELRNHRWPGWNINQYLGQDVHRTTLGVVGWGRIGQAVGRRAAGFDMTVIHHARHPTGDPGYTADLDDLLARADIVTLHVPLTDETRHLIDARRLALMKPTAVLVNTARGPVVDEAALAEALHRGTIFAAGIDVYEREPEVHPRLLSAPNTTLLPHLGSASVATRTAMGRLAAQSALDVLEGRTPATLVTPPASA